MTQLRNPTTPHALGLCLHRCTAVLISALLTFSALSTAFAQSDLDDGHYDIDTYLSMQADADRAYDALQAASHDAPDYGQRAREAVSLRTGLISYLRSWESSGTMPAEMVAGAQEARLVLYQNVVRIFSDLGECADARSTSEALSTLVESGDFGLQAHDAMLEARAAVIECESQQPVASTDEASVDDAANGATNGVGVVLTPPERPNRVLPVTLIATGVAAIGGALAWDASAAGAGDDLDALRASDRCFDDNSCLASTQSEFDDLNSKVSTARIGVATLIGVGSVATITGIVLLVTGRSRDDEAGVSVLPAVTPTYAGVTLNSRF